MTRDDECVYDSASSFKHMHLCYYLAGRRETTRKPPEEHVKKKKNRFSLENWKMDFVCGKRDFWK